MQGNRWTKQDILTVLGAVQAFVMGLNMVINQERKFNGASRQVPEQFKNDAKRTPRGRPRRPRDNQRHQNW